MGLIRFLLATSVVSAHAGPILGFTLLDSDVAVKAFYIISGFYMALILNEKYIYSNNSYSLFITNRFLRIYPLYWIVLLLTILYSIMLIDSKDSNLSQLNNYATNWDDMKTETFIFLLFTNIFLFFQDVVMFLGFNTTSGELFFTSNFQNTNPQLHTFLFVPQAWTIGIELTFYLIAPFVAKKKLKLLFFGIFLCLGVRIMLSLYGFKNDPWSYRFFPSELVFFLLGVVSYRIYSKVRGVDIKHSYLQAILSFTLAFAIFYGFLPTSVKQPVFLIILFVSIPFIFLLSKNWKLDSYIGELSYPIYISHLLVLNCMNLWVDDDTGFLKFTAIILFSVLLNELFSKPIDRYRRNRVSLTVI